MATTITGSHVVNTVNTVCGGDGDGANPTLNAHSLPNSHTSLSDSESFEPLPLGESLPDVFWFPKHQLVWNAQTLSLAQTPVALSADLLEEISHWAHEEEWQLRANRQVESVGLGELQSISINVTQICNLQCVYCAAGGDGTFGDPQAKADLDEIFKKLSLLLNRRLEDLRIRKAEVRSTSESDSTIIEETKPLLVVNFTGGEPLLYPLGIRLLADWIVEQGRHDGFMPVFHVVTNGTLLTHENVDLLATYKMNVSLSFDGSKQWLQRPFKNKAAVHPSGEEEVTKWWEEWKKGVNRLFSAKERLGKIVASVVINKNNFDVMGIFQDLKEWPFDAVDFSFDYWEDSAAVNEHFIKGYCDLMAQLYQEGGEKELRKLVFVDRIFNILDLQKPVVGYCGAGQRRLTVSARGTIHPCVWLAGTSDTAMKEQDLGRIWEAKGALERLGCATCWARNVCRGGCHFQHSVAAAEHHERLFCRRMKQLIGATFLYYKRREYDTPKEEHISF
ncbi:MAG: radical SAM protein [Bdellovibrionaceae bacterium]|nr:radical SAM protein [Pseudobdellovibrionaceae bacterium]